MSGTRHASHATLSPGRRVALVVLVVATVIAVAWKFWPRPDEPVADEPVPAQLVVPGTVLKSSECGNQASEPFVPTRISVPQVGANSPVLALGRDSRNVPRAPDLSSAGKEEYGWDDPSQATPGVVDDIKPPGAMPGSDRGNVLMNAHTWPDGSALGNRLMEHLQVGDKLVLRGKGGTELCYQVTKRIVIKASDGSMEYYENDGPPQLALIVCTAPRTGPGQWENRTIWFASPIGAEAPA